MICVIYVGRSGRVATDGLRGSGMRTRTWQMYFTQQLELRAAGRFVA